MFHARQAYDWFQRMVQAMPAELAVEDRDRPVPREAVLRVLQVELRPMLTYGPDYQRSVADHAQRALVDFNRGRGEEALHWLEQACEAAARIRQADAYDPAERYVTATSWKIFYSVGGDIVGAHLHVHDFVRDGQGGFVVWHPVHDDRKFTSREEASAYALRMGLLQRFVPQFVSA